MSEKYIKPEGHTCKFSSTIMDTLSVGTGELDQHGFWEHGCYECARAWEKANPNQEVWPFSRETLNRMDREKAELLKISPIII